MTPLTTHLTEEQLVDLYYEPAAHPHIDSCLDCREHFRDLSATLNAFNDLPVPESPPFTWRAPLSYRLKRWAPYILVPTFAAALFVAFFLGRQHPAPTQFADSGRERILLVALDTHLQRSQMVLLELANGDPASLPEARQRARDLIGENRLYRQTTLYSGDRNYADLLEQLDRVLTVSANSQSQSSTPHDDQIEQLLFKIRVTDQNLQKGTEKL